MTDNVVFEVEANARGRYRVEVWDVEMWLRVGQGYGYDDLGEAKQVASSRAWLWGEKTRVIDTQPETPAVDAQNGGNNATPAETRTSTGEGSHTRLETAHSEPTSKPCKSDMDTYQTASGETAIYPNTTVEQGLDYLIPALTAEAGEVAGKWAKWKRDSNNLGMTRELRDEIVTECGDVLWTLARITEDLGFSLSEVADSNIQKLQDRQQAAIWAIADALHGDACPVGPDPDPGESCGCGYYAREAEIALAAAAPHLRAAWAEEIRAIEVPAHNLHDQLPSDHWYAGQKIMRDEIAELLEGGDNR